MPVHRATERVTTTASRTAETHSSRLVKLRSRIRKLMDQELKDLTGNRKARMRWSFGNLSDVPGGQPVMELLLALWTSGMLRFEEASEDEIDLAVWNPTAILPGVPLGRPQRAAVQSIRGAEDSDDPIEEAVWSSEVEGEASESGIDELAD